MEDPPRTVGPRHQVRTREHPSRGQAMARGGRRRGPRRAPARARDPGRARFARARARRRRASPDARGPAPSSPDVHGRGRCPRAGSSFASAAAKPHRGHRAGGWAAPAFFPGFCRLFPRAIGEANAVSATVAREMAFGGAGASPSTDGVAGSLPCFVASVRARAVGSPGAPPGRVGAVPPALRRRASPELSPAQRLLPSYDSRP